VMPRPTPKKPKTTTRKTARKNVKKTPAAKKPAAKKKPAKKKPASKSLEDSISVFLEASLAYGRATMATIELGGTKTSVVAERLWLEAHDRSAVCLVEARCESEPVYDDDGMRYYGDDLVSLEVEAGAAAPTDCPVFITLRCPPTARVHEVVAYVDHDRVLAIALRMSNGVRLLVQAETVGFVSVRSDPTQIEEILADLENDGAVVGASLSSPMIASIASM
jgi:hypothetical protein